MKPLTRAFLISLLMLSITAVAAEPLDSKGWGNTTWGMTPQQVIGAEPRAKLNATPNKMENGWVEAASIDGLEIGGIEFAGAFTFKHNKLVMVRLSSGHKKAQFCYDFEFTSTEQSLTQKYGAPALHTAKKDNKQSTWRLPSTSITLSYFAVDGIAYNLGCTSFLNILYKQVGADKNDL
jgi:hypothetical protein